MQNAIHILLLETNLRDAGLISSELTCHGIEHVSHCVTNKEDFQAALGEFRPELIVANYAVAQFDDTNALALAQGQCPDVPVIMVAGSSGDGLAVETIRRGASDFIPKDRLSQLAPAVVRAVREAEERKQRRRAEVLLELKYQQLSLQNEALQQSEERFRQLAESIREVFWMTDVDKEQMLYISPAYEEIWGRSCASLYATPRDWLEALHPDDRDRVVNAAHQKQASGAYDEHYRIVRPDGSVRWIHDRAFPVRDQTGSVYRVAGVAEDISSRRHLETRVLEISDLEQARIGRDLHDGLCQLLVSIGFNAHTLKQDLDKRSGEEARSAERIGQKLSQAIKMARHFAHGLCPVNFQSENLSTALSHLAQNTCEDYGIVCEAECAAVEFAPAVATHLYRIAQEAVHNAVKHGEPTRIFVRLTVENGKGLLKIVDNGRGIAPAAGEPRRSMGLEIMKYRASVIGGSLEARALEPSEGRGTIVTCIFPEKAIV